MGGGAASLRRRSSQTVRHPLLLQSNGFEGLAPLWVHLHPYQHAVAHGPDESEALVQFHPAAPCRGARKPDHDDPVSGIDELLCLYTNVLVYLEQPPERIADLLAPPRPRLDGTRKLLPLEVRRHHPAVEVALCPALIDPSHDLHVLARNTRSPRRFSPSWVPPTSA